MKIKSPILLLVPCLLTLSVLAQHATPIQFIENKGQWDNPVRFMANVSGGALYVHQNGFTVLQHNEKDWHQLEERMHHHQENDGAMKQAPLVVHSHAYRVSFANASPKATVLADKPLPTHTNYFIGNDPSKWASNCKVYQGITIQNIYPGIDVRYYSDNGSMKYDLIVKPGGNVADIQLNYEGAEGLEVKDKMLNIKTSIGTVRELQPYAYQYTPNGKQPVKASYKVKGNKEWFDVKDYDPAQTLIIDPTMVFASFSNSTADNWGYTATYGPDGSMFGGGIVLGGQGFPVTPGAFQQTYAGGDFDIGIIKLSPDGSNRVYATYIGGSGKDQPHSLIADAQGNLIIAGRTNSSNYPVTGTSSTGIFGKGGGFDIIVTKLSADGSALIGSKRIGGTGDDGLNGTTDGHGAPGTLKLNYGDDGRSEVILDGAGNIYVASCTRSLTGSADDKFPTTPGAFQTQPGGGEQDGVVLKLSPNVDVLFSSFLGGSDADAAFVLSLNPLTSDLYVAGGTNSTNFPGTGPTSFQENNQGGIDGFVAMISNDGSSLIKSTYVGSEASLGQPSPTPTDIIWGIKFDRLGYPYVMGQTLGNWRITTQWGQPGGRQFITKLKPDLSGYVYSTAFGTANASSPNISPVAFLVDRCENVYVSGWGGEEHYTTFKSAGTMGLPVTPDALVMNPPYSSPSQTDGKDFYFFVLKKDGIAQLYGSFYGQNGGWPDHVDGGTSRFDENGIIYQAICANCSANPKPYYPTTPGVWGPTNPGPDCNLAMIKIALNLSGVHSGVQSAINGVPRDTAGCVPLKVDFRDTVLNAVSYEWDFNGDGITDTATMAPQASHIYTAVGHYRVRLIAVDSSSCNIRDTSYLNIRVGDLQALPDFTYQKLDPCQALSYRFNNTSFQPPVRPFTSTSFVWDFGDNTPKLTTGYGPVTHSYATPGTYKVKLYLRDTAYCNSPDSMVKSLNIATLVKASFETPSPVCAPHNAIFKYTGSGGQQFFWDFGDGGTSTDVNPVHFYANPGSYLVRLRVVDSATCNVEDSTSFTLQAIAKPVAVIGNVSPQPPIVNTPLSFTNNSSSDAIRFKWFFGDGDSLNTASRDLVTHEYNTTKKYDVKLIAFNSNGCSDTAFRQVQTLVQPALDVPNAFTPLSGGVNGVVQPRGFAIGKMKFTIYNRWGQKVFETENRKEGWDGRYKGVVQPMDVYVYTLEVEFTDGTKATKKGDITLIR